MEYLLFSSEIVEDQQVAVAEFGFFDRLLDGHGLQSDGLAGGDCFTRYHESLRLTAQGNHHRSEWALPRWFYPRNGCFPLTYHYETQPLPTWIGWYARQLPAWFQPTRLSTSPAT